MHRLIFLCFSFFICSNAFAQGLDDYNLDFEKLIPNTKFASKWFSNNNSKGISIIADATERHGGQYSLLIENLNNEEPVKYTQSGIFIPAKYQGSEIEIKLYAKLKDVAHHVDFSARIDGQDYELLQFKNSLKSQISGNRNWQQYSLKLPLSNDARRICFWPTLYGAGKLWIDDVQILIDGVDISRAKIKTDYNPNTPQPINYGNNAAASGKVKVKNAELYYEIYGSGEPLLLLHGNSQSIHVFKKQIKEFSKSYKVIAVDTRGQGKSIDLSTSPLSYDLFAEDMKTLLDSLHIPKAHILGWSDGGNTGLIMAHKYPSYVNKLAVMGACTNPNDAVSEATLKEVADANKSLLQKTDQQSQKQARLFTLLLTEPHITLEELKHINSPVLVMAGEKDMILEKHTKYIASNIPNGKLLIFKGASHYAPVEIVSEFNDAVLNFLNSK